MKEKIYSKLVAKFPQMRKDGLEHIARSLSLVATEETFDKLVEDLSAEAVENAIKEWRSSADAETNKAIEAYKQKHPAPTPNPAPAPVPEPTPTPTPTPTHAPAPFDMEAMMAKMTEAIGKAVQPLQGKIAELEGRNVAEKRLSAVQKELEGMPKSYSDAIVTAFQSKQFDNDEAFNAEIQSIREGVTAFRNDLAEQGLREFTAGGNPNKEPQGEASADVVAYLKKKNEGGDGLGGKQL